MHDGFTLAQDGFTLVELMLVLWLIGILYTLARPSFNSFIAKARRAEAKSMLAHLHELQKIYRVENGSYYAGSGEMNSANRYGGFVPAQPPTAAYHACDNNQLNFHIDGCEESRYKYWVGTANEHGYVAFATGKKIYPGCEMNQEKVGTAVIYSTKTGSASILPSEKGDTLYRTNKVGPELYIDIIEECY